MSNHVMGYLVCAGIIGFGLIYHLGGWLRGRRGARGRRHGQ